jgi:hypothetical protein
VIPTIINTSGDGRGEKDGASHGEHAAQVKLIFGNGM